MKKLMILAILFASGTAFAFDAVYERPLGKNDPNTKAFLKFLQNPEPRPQIIDEMLGSKREIPIYLEDENMDFVAIFLVKSPAALKEEADKRLEMLENHNAFANVSKNWKKFYSKRLNSMKTATEYNVSLNIFIKKSEENFRSKCPANVKKISHAEKIEKCLMVNQVDNFLEYFIRRDVEYIKNLNEAPYQLVSQSLVNEFIVAGEWIPQNWLSGNFLQQLEMAAKEPAALKNAIKSLQLEEITEDVMITWPNDRLRLSIEGMDYELDFNAPLLWRESQNSNITTLTAYSAIQFLKENGFTYIDQNWINWGPKGAQPILPQAKAKELFPNGSNASHTAAGSTFESIIRAMEKHGFSFIDSRWTKN